MKLQAALLGASSCFWLSSSALERANAQAAPQPPTEAPSLASSEATSGALSEATPEGPSQATPEAPPRATSEAAAALARGPTVDYELRARLDEERHQVNGEGTITLHNKSRASLSRLYVHLYLNAFESRRSVFFRTNARARSGRQPSQWGRLDVTSLRREGSADHLWPPGAHSPDDPDDRTDITVELPSPILPGQAARFEIAWTSQLPSLVERTGYVSDFHFVAQWFPKLAKLEPDGTWAHFTFHPHSEFYANFGDYDVTLDVARELIVGASGELEREVQSGERKQLQFRASAVHDFAWTAWSDFETVDSEWQGVRIHSLYPPGHERNAAHSLRAVAHGLRFYGERFGRYPYPELTVVHPPDWANAAGGMEYPGLITTGGPWYAGWLSHAPEAVTLHELGHQWFYGLLASNEAQWPFLDEGFTSFAEARAMSALLGQGNGLRLAAVELSSTAYYRWWGNDASAPIAQAAAKFDSFADIGVLAYSRMASLLETLSRVYPDFDAALSRYAREQRFSHPTPGDFLDIVQQQVGTEARVQTERALFEKGTVDFAVGSAQSTPLASGGQQILVVLERKGELQFPVDVEFTHADGSVILRHWDGQSAETRIEYGADSPLRGVTIDRELRVVLDSNLSNNARMLSSPSTPHWHRRLLHWLTLALRSVLP